MDAMAMRAARPDRQRTAVDLSSIVKIVGAPIAVGVAYYVAARLSLNLALVGESVTPLWPATGIALVGFLWFGYRIAPAVTIAAFLVNWRIGPSVAAAAWIAAGNTLAPAAAAAVLRFTNFRPALDRTRDAIALVMLGALSAMTISATVGSLALWHFGAIAREDFWSTWAVWWAGDAVGILAIAPFLLGMRSLRLVRPIAWVRVAEAFLLFGVLSTAAIVVTTTERHFLFAVFPVLVWIAWRFEQRGAGTAALVVIVTASWAAANNTGPFKGADLLGKMMTLQIFNAAASLLSFFFAAVVLERSRNRQELDRSARELYQREHQIATTLQRSLLPEDLPAVPDIEVAARYIPATSDIEVGGDWYDIIQLPDGRLGVAIGDVAGHGVEAAAVMGQLRMALRVYALQGLSPAEACKRLNTLLIQLRPGTMATLAFGHVDPESGSFTVVKAGHPPPLIVSEDGTSTFVQGGVGPPVGVDSIGKFEETTVELPFGSTLFLYTDGLIERRGESLDRGLQRLARAAADSPVSLEDAGDRLVETLLGSHASDDTAILAIRRRALAGRPLKLEIPADPSKLVWIRQILKRWLRQNGAGENDVAEMLLACTEACANAVQHAYRAREGRLEIEGIREDQTIVLSIRDFGTWKPFPSKADDDGHGLTLMKGLMDTVSVVSGVEGTEVRMSRRLGALVEHE